MFNVVLMLHKGITIYSINKHVEMWWWCSWW